MSEDGLSYILKYLGNQAAKISILMNAAFLSLLLRKCMQFKEIWYKRGRFPKGSRPILNFCSIINTVREGNKAFAPK